MPAALLRALDLTIGRRVEGLLTGEYRSAALGVGTELAQIQLYQPGDDVRRIDWNVTARTGKPHVRVQLAERTLATWLALDTSASMGFGTVERRKSDVAEGVALAIGHIATRRGNRLGVVTFGGEDDRSVPLRPGRAGLVGLLAALRSEPPLEGPGETTLALALARTSRLARQRAVVAVVSDFRGPREWRGPLLRLAARHELLAIEVRDQREQSLPNVGHVWLFDPESGRHLRVDTSDRGLCERFASAAEEDREQLRHELHAAGADHVVLETGGDWLRSLAEFLRRRRLSGR
jgi:uncharacterized protein (DUF58 family)